jgi:hypothetical protein
VIGQHEVSALLPFDKFLDSPAEDPCGRDVIFAAKGAEFSIGPSV